MKRLASVPRLLLVLVLVVLAGFPVYWMLSTALSSSNQLYGGTQPLWPQITHLPETLRSTAEVPILRWMGNSLFIAGGVTVISLGLGSLGGYGLSRHRFRGKGLVNFLLFMTQVLPEALILVPLYAMFIALGLLNSMWGLVLANVGFALPVSTFIIKSAIDAVPRELEESAAIDNCSRIGALTMIVLPLVAPSMAAAAVIAFFSGWNEFLFAATFMSDQSSWPVSVGLASFIGQYDTPLASVMASALVFSLPAIVFFLIVQRKIVSGLTAGAVKG